MAWRALRGGVGGTRSRVGLTRIEAIKQVYRPDWPAGENRVCYPRDRPYRHRGLTPLGAKLTGQALRTRLEWTPLTKMSPCSVPPARGGLASSRSCPN